MGADLGFLGLNCKGGLRHFAGMHGFLVAGWICCLAVMIIRHVCVTIFDWFGIE